MRLKKSKAQHMLLDTRILKRIVDYAEVSEEDTVLEVGCGTGNLTEYLLERCKVIGIEVDREMVKHLKVRFKDKIDEGKFELIQANALKIEFPSFTKFVSNIPYKISSPLTFKLFNHDFELAVVMYQREFAERLCKPEVHPNKLGIIAKMYCKAEILEIVKSSAFKPRPKVESAIVKIVPKAELKVKNRRLFEDFVKFIFSRRRKKLGKVIEEWGKLNGVGIEVPSEIRDKRVEEVNFRVLVDIVNELL
ncbi:ribosomal RNA small subunit methyltransferase A [Archaeoglobales archaeon]|nr:MAG: ribosomal RNA small subunit methyltransferase A [Archaeoglobales archaeon]